MGTGGVPRCCVFEVLWAVGDGGMFLGCCLGIEEASEAKGGATARPAPLGGVREQGGYAGQQRALIAKRGRGVRID